MKNLLCLMLTILLSLPLLTACVSEGNSDDISGDQTQTETFALSDELTPDVDVNPTMEYMLSDDDRLKPYTVEMAKNKINVLDRGVVTDDPNAAEENLEIINKLMEDAPNDCAVIFPEGTYYLASNTEKGGIYVKNKENFILHGENAKIINVSYDPIKVVDKSLKNLTNIFRIGWSKNLTVEGFELDFLSHTTADGVVTKIRNGYTYFTVYDEFVNKGNPITGGENAYAVNMFDTDGNPEEEYYLTKGEYTVEKDGDGQFDFKIKGSYGKKGQQICVRCSSSSQTTPTFYLIQLENIAIRDVFVRSCPGNIIYAPAGNENILIERLTVEPEAGSRKILATNVDSIHTSGTRGRIEVRDCRFIGLGDDALNVHSRVALISSADGNTITAGDKYSGNDLEDHWASTGDVIEFYDKDLNSLGKSVLKSHDGGTLRLDSLPEGVTDGCFALNISYSPVTVVSNCVVKRGRARAFLLQTKNAAITNCDISDLRLSAVIISPDFDEWYEGGFADNVIISNNKIENCCRSSSTRNYGAILIAGCHDCKKLPKSGVIGHKNITIKDNIFTGCNSYAVYHHGAANVKLIGNTVTDCRDEEKAD